MSEADCYLPEAKVEADCNDPNLKSISCFKAIILRVFFQVGKSKRVEVKEFKGQLRVDIRETYVDKSSGETKLGKKGFH